MRARNVFEEEKAFQLTRETLAKTRRRALRQRCWHRALNRLERGIIDLTLRCVKEVKSSKLRATLETILAKLIEAFRPSYLHVVEKAGRHLAARISRLAQSWGNTRAAEWEDDAAFIRYWGMKALNPENPGLGGLCQ